MTKSKTSIAVLFEFDGFRAVAIDNVERMVLTTGRGSKEKKSVSYKGKRYNVFGLPRDYGVGLGSCISVKGVV